MPTTFIKEVRQDGVKSAWKHFKERRHLLPIAGYLILAAITAYTFGAERAHSTEARRVLASQTHTVLIASCERQNELRETLHGLILQGIPQTKKFVEEGTLTPAQGERAIVNTKRAAKKLKSIDCEKAYPVPKG